MRLLPAGAVALLLVLAVARPTADQQKKKRSRCARSRRLHLRRTLDRMPKERFDEAIQAVARAGDEVGRNLRRHWPVTAGHGSMRSPAAARSGCWPRGTRARNENLFRARRLARLGRPGVCRGLRALDWAQLQLIERGAPDRAERAWYLAAAALAGGVRDWRYLHRPVTLGRTRAGRRLIDRALIRFPSDPALRLEQAIAAAGRFNIIGEGAPRGRPTEPRSPRSSE